MTLVEKDIKPLDIINEKSLDNAFVLDMAMGGSTNTVLHALAVANEAGVEYDLERINSISEKCPNICKVSPSSKFHMEDVDAAGGVSAILKEISNIKGMVNKDCLTVTGKTIWKNISRAKKTIAQVTAPATMIPIKTLEAMVSVSQTPCPALESRMR